MIKALLFFLAWERETPLQMGLYITFVKRNALLLDRKEEGRELVAFSSNQSLH